MTGPASGQALVESAQLAEDAGGAGLAGGGEGLQPEGAGPGRVGAAGSGEGDGELPYGTLETRDELTHWTEMATD